MATVAQRLKILEAAVAALKTDVADLNGRVTKLETPPPPLLYGDGLYGEGLYG